jgi:hypothetical protein
MLAGTQPTVHQQPGSCVFTEKPHCCCVFPAAHSGTRGLPGKGRPVAHVCWSCHWLTLLTLLLMRGWVAGVLTAALLLLLQLHLLQPLPSQAAAAAGVAAAAALLPPPAILLPAWLLAAGAQ